jgi:hypothetical protein
MLRKIQGGWQVSKDGSDTCWAGPLCNSWNQLQLESKEHEGKIKQNLNICWFANRLAAGSDHSWSLMCEGQSNEWNIFPHSSRCVRKGCGLSEGPTGPAVLCPEENFWKSVAPRRRRWTRRRIWRLRHLPRYMDWPLTGWSTNRCQSTGPFKLKCLTQSSTGNLPPARSLLVCYQYQSQERITCCLFLSSCLVCLA